MLGLVEGLVLVLFLFLSLPVSLFIVIVSLCSAVGRWLGFRRKYVSTLLYIFEYGRKRIERANRLRALDQEQPSSHVAGDEDEDNNEADDGISTADSSDDEFVDAASSLTIIKRTISGSEEEEEVMQDDFDLGDIFAFIRGGIRTIVKDQVTHRFASEELKSWNLLTRTNRVYEFISWRLSIIWLLGFLVRYCFLLPMRVTICFFGVLFLTMSTGLVGCIPERYHSTKQRLYKIVYLQSFEFLSWSLSAVIRHNDLENRPGAATRIIDGKSVKTEQGGICVANHTSPIDVLVLAVDQCYDMVGQRHGGFLGILQRALARASSHIWFERSEMKDREAVARRLKEHVEDADKLPILIFPEGTCINNSAVMQFKKGSFEVGGVIFPVAIKYDARFGDPFWDSSQYSMVQYLLMMMSSWAIVCDVWYLPPMARRSGESAVDFANRVKSQIARKGGLVDLDWDGQLKRAFAKKEWKEQQQLEYFHRKFAHSISPKKKLPELPKETKRQDNT